MKSDSSSPRSLVTPGPAFTLVEMLVVIAVLGMLLALLLPQLSRAKTQAQNTACVSQLHQLGLAVRVFAEDNDSKLPIAERLPSMPMYADRNLPRICDVLAASVGQAAGATNGAPVFKCPGDREGFYEIEGSSYLWNAALNGRRIDAGQTLRVLGVGNTTNFVPIQVDTNLTFASAATPLLSDYDNFHPRSRKPGKNTVFMDGHVAPPPVVPSH